MMAQVTRVRDDDGRCGVVEGLCGPGLTLVSHAAICERVFSEYESHTTSDGVGGVHEDFSP